MHCSRCVSALNIDVPCGGDKTVYTTRCWVLISPIQRGVELRFIPLDLLPALKACYSKNPIFYSVKQ